MRFLLGWLLLISSASLLRAESPKEGVHVQTADGVHLAGDYFRSSKAGPGILLFHQCSRDRSVWDGLATTLAGAGNHVLVVNPRGVGDSQGEQWDYDGSLEHALEYWRKNWARDAESAYQWLVSQPNVKSDSVVAMGGGCGAFLALLTAQQHPSTIHSAVLFSDFEDDSLRSFLRNAMDLAIFSAVSEQDPMSFDAAKDIHSLSHHSANHLAIYAEKAHGFALIEQHPELQQSVLTWVQLRLPPNSDGIAEILHSHEMDREDHLRGDATHLASRLPAEYISVAEGKLKHLTREDTLKQFQQYFAGRKHRAWEDLEPPVVQVAPSGDMAWAIFRVRSRYTDLQPDGSRQDGEFVCAWTSTYEKRDGQWWMTSVTSTFESQR